MHYFTICARNYLGYALTLRDSVLRAEPGAHFTIFLADDQVDDAEVAAFTVPAQALNIPGFEDMCFRYTLMELSTAIKPYCFDHVFDQMGAARAVYLDPDIEVFRPIDAVRQAFDAGASAVLTPHILQPYQDNKTPGDLDILSSGTFNLGFGAFAKVPEARDFITWWGRKTRTDCYVDLPRGKFVDQKWVDFAPSFLADLHVLRDPGYNVAYWNLSGRPVEAGPDGLTAGGAPLVFFHFSGVVPGDRTVFSKHQDRITMDTAGPAADLVRAYLDQLDAKGQANWASTPYAYACYEDGTPIPPPVRRGPLTGGDLATTLKAYDSTYWNALSPDVEQSDGAPVTRLMLAVHAMRTDLQETFPLTSESGRKGFHAWFITHAGREQRLTDEMMPAGSSRQSQLTAAMRRTASRLRNGKR